MRAFGLIGYPLGHSFSAGYFAKKFENENINDCTYRNFPIENISKLPEIITANPDLIGLNVTIPYKEQVIPFLDEINADAKDVGAVNTIKISRNNTGYSIKGFNSDIFGFEQSLHPLLKDYHNKALILGSGGASKAIKYILKKLNIEYISASIEELKENEIHYENID